MGDKKDGAGRIRGREVLSDTWYKLETISFEQTGQDGQPETQKREVYHNGPGVAVLPIDRAHGRVLLVRQLRIPALVNSDSPMLVEACAGCKRDPVKHGGPSRTARWLPRFSRRPGRKARSNWPSPRAGCTRSGGR